ncbi:hypothetical protein [Dysgonomonas sp. ZJ279]|uniref:hypothetical protein n=1 Tax=Dysgonomonas sp. ZJ279 TaxID=2709796 RepID=UPI0013EC2EA1|nr:hypothetical protein [Dysgonomonas sp. ZJ279]
MRIKIIILVLGSLLLSCSSSKPIQEVISIKQIETDYPVIIRGDIDKNEIFSINFHFAFKYKNESSIKRKISIIDYYYCKDHGKSYTNAFGGWGGIKMYEHKNDSLIRIDSYYKNKPINFSEDQEFVVYTSHEVDTALIFQSELRPYLEQIKARGTTHGKDTLSIGTFNEFKKKHPKLTKILLGGDSIDFRILNSENQMDTLIVLPIRY